MQKAWIFTVCNGKIFSVQHIQLFISFDLFPLDDYRVIDFVAGLITSSQKVVTKRIVTNRKSYIGIYDRRLPFTSSYSLKSTSLSVQFKNNNR